MGGGVRSAEGGVVPTGGSEAGPGCPDGGGWGVVRSFFSVNIVHGGGPSDRVFLVGRRRVGRSRLEHTRTVEGEKLPTQSGCACGGARVQSRKE